MYVDRNHDFKYLQLQVIANFDAFLWLSQGRILHLNSSALLSRQMHGWNHTNSPSRYFTDPFLEFLRVPSLLKHRNVA